MSASALRRFALPLAAALFAGSIAFSLGGMTVMKLAPAAVVPVAHLLPILMKAPTWVYVVTLPAVVFLTFLPHLGLRTSLGLALWGSGVGLSAELLGTTTGFPFGAYGYTDFLGWKILGHVPWGIPPSWYAASMLSWAFACRLRLPPARRVVVAAFFLVLWDVALDPAMSAGFPVWDWAADGPFYGMPWVNWLGWFGTGLVIMTGFERLTRARPVSDTPWIDGVWLLNGTFAIGICVWAGLGLAVVVGTAALALPLLVTRRLMRVPLREAATAA